MKITRNELKNAVLGAIMGIFATAVWDCLRDIPLFSTLIKISKWVWINILNFTIPFWILILIVIFWKILKLTFFKRGTERNNSLEFLNYNEDDFDGLKWRWQWKKNSSGKYNVDNLTIVCSKCQTPMKFDAFSNCYICPRCNKRIRDFKSPYDVESVIIDNLNRGIINSKNITK